jgi:hypothetical protein
MVKAHTLLEISSLMINNARAENRAQIWLDVKVYISTYRFKSIMASIFPWGPLLLIGGVPIWERGISGDDKATPRYFNDIQTSSFTIFINCITVLSSRCVSERCRAVFQLICSENVTSCTALKCSTTILSLLTPSSLQKPRMR